MSGGLNNGSLLFPRATCYTEKDCPLRNFAATSHLWLQKENISETFQRRTDHQSIIKNVVWIFHLVIKTFNK